MHRGIIYIRHKREIIILKSFFLFLSHNASLFDQVITDYRIDKKKQMKRAIQGIRRASSGT